MFVFAVIILFAATKTFYLHVCQAPFDHGLDVVPCLVVYPVDIVAETEGDIWLFSP